MTVGRTYAAAPQADMAHRLMTVGDVAEWLQCSRQAVYCWAELGYLSHIKIGRLVRFTREDVLAFVESGRRAGGGAL